MLINTKYLDTTTKSSDMRETVKGVHNINSGNASWSSEITLIKTNQHTSRHSFVKIFSLAELVEDNLLLASMIEVVLNTIQNENHI